MIVLDKPNPFRVLGLSTDAGDADIVQRFEELHDTAGTEDERLLYRWAKEQLITTEPLTRIEYELFEVPGSQYENSDWERFMRMHNRNPIDPGKMADDLAAPQIGDFDMGGLIRLFLDELLKLPQSDMRAAIVHNPFTLGPGDPTWEVRDVFFG